MVTASRWTERVDADPQETSLRVYDHRFELEGFAYD
ncbi:hypothetical protein ABIE89_000194 [Bradyrhizobium niftali]